jgi:hypothetical protein
VTNRTDTRTELAHCSLLSDAKRQAIADRQCRDGTPTHTNANYIPSRGPCLGGAVKSHRYTDHRSKSLLSAGTLGRRFTGSSNDPYKPTVGIGPRVTPHSQCGGVSCRNELGFGAEVNAP